MLLKLLVMMKKRNMIWGIVNIPSVPTLVLLKVLPNLLNTSISIVLWRDVYYFLVGAYIYPITHTYMYLLIRMCELDYFLHITTLPETSSKIVVTARICNYKRRPWTNLSYALLKSTSTLSARGFKLATFQLLVLIARLPSGVCMCVCWYRGWVIENDPLGQSCVHLSVS